MAAASDRSERRTAWAMVAAQVALLAVILIHSGPSLWTFPTALHWVFAVVAVVALIPMAVAGIALGRGLTAVPLPNAHAQLRTGGLYRFVRHPIYGGLLAAALAWTGATGALSAVAATLLLWGLLHVKARWEEARLAERFPGYPAYAAATARFLPVPRGHRSMNRKVS